MNILLNTIQYIFKMGNCLCMKKTVALNGKTYIVRDSIGEGGFSTVELVEDTQTRHWYALKRITCHSPRDQEVALVEVQYHSQLCHPNVIQCIASDVIGRPDLIGSKTSQVLILLPFFSKGTLHDELFKRAPINHFFDEATVLRIFLGICQGVAHFHQQTPPLAHRDLKTSNILLGTDLSPLIMDLGSTSVARVLPRSFAEARELEDLCSERCSMTYRAPELFRPERDKQVTEASDIWSLGCLLFAMCFFKSPYDPVYERGDSVALAVIAGSTSLPLSHPYTQGLCSLIQCMLKVEPTERPSIQQLTILVQSLGAQTPAVC